MQHVFGFPDGDLGWGEQLCQEPRMPKTELLYHVSFELLPDGDLRCKRCGETFKGVVDGVARGEGD